MEQPNLGCPYPSQTLSLSLSHSLDALSGVCFVGEEKTFNSILEQKKQKQVSCRSHCTHPHLISLESPLPKDYKDTLIISICPATAIPSSWTLSSLRLTVLPTCALSESSYLSAFLPERFDLDLWNFQGFRLILIRIQIPRLSIFKASDYLLIQSSWLIRHLRALRR